MPLPKPRTGEERDKFISRCISFAVRDGMPQKQAVAACHTSWRRAKGIKEPKSKMDSIQLSYKVPIEIVEQPTTGETGKETEFLIQGIAINATVTDNRHKFIGEELESAAETLRNVPLLKDHDNMIESIVGRVIDVEYVPAKENIRFKARINNIDSVKFVKDLIKAGDLNTVSIGANVEKIDEEDGLFIPRGITFKELSLVAVPADSGAEFTFTGNTFDLALKEAYKSYSQPDIVEDKQLNKQEKEEDMEDEQKKTEPEAPEEESEEEKEKEKTDETSEKLDALTNLVATSIADNKKIGERITKLESADADEVPEAPVEEPKVEEPKEEPTEDEPKEDESEDEEEEEGEEESVDERGYKIVQQNTSFSVVRNKDRFTPESYYPKVERRGR